ncbi:chemotaxis protein [Candidatus Symbiobacter mobilis]|uniref:Chemotaxis signal transduction protein n=1 Tax=Candidatus Symbiobacter mobilis CR TaxID=946483 RepID=U5N9A1_9BURK|nr:chemotaxis protein [Candidatus Symbiobacter mobilis]AGX87875.1 chemotaxis signal transduction protein [Candidatus Symbiobacter mobilis CR]
MSIDQDIEERTKLAGTNKFELLLFRLGESPSTGERELYGINVFKVREVLVMPKITALANAHEHLMGVANIRGQIIPVINLSAVIGCKPKLGHTILMVTEFARTVQAFAVEDVREIVRLDWDQVLPAEGTHAGTLVTGIARLDPGNPDTRLAQVLDVEQVIREVSPDSRGEAAEREMDKTALPLPPGTVILVADDSYVARSVIELGLKAMNASYIMTKTGKEAWDYLQNQAEQAKAEGMMVRNKVAVVLTDLEMPEMDGFTLTKLIKQDSRFRGMPVVIHSSLTGTTNEVHVKGVGADGYVAKFSPSELSATLRRVLSTS